MDNFKKTISIIYLLLTASAFCNETPTVIIAMNAWEPIKYETEPYGILAQITKEAFALEGVEVEFRVAPWKRGYDNVLSGLWHGIVGWNSTYERELVFNVSTPLLLEDVVFFHHKDLEFDWDNLKDLEGLSVGLIEGYNYGSALKQAIDENLLVSEITSSEEQSIKMLQKKRFDLWPCEVDVGLYLVKSYLPTEQAEEITFNPEPIQISDLCLLLSKEIPENKTNAILFEKGLKSLKDSGRYDELLKEYLPESMTQNKLLISDHQ